MTDVLASTWAGLEFLKAGGVPEAHGDIDQSDSRQFGICLGGSSVPQNDPNCAKAH
jgi:hypothetical protein